MPTLAFIDTETTGLDPNRHEIWEVGLILRRLVPGPVVEAMTGPLDDPGAVSTTTAALVSPKIHASKAGVFADVEYVWQLPVDLVDADPAALNIGRFHERRWPPPDDGPTGWTESSRAALSNDRVGGRLMTGARLSEAEVYAWAVEFERLTWGAHMIGCVPSFDTQRLDTLLRRYAACPGWHYQPVDVETLAVGALTRMPHIRKIRYVADKYRATVNDEVTISGVFVNPGSFSGHAVDITEPPWNTDWIAEAFGVYVKDNDRHTALGDARMARDLWDAVHAETE